MAHSFCDDPRCIVCLAARLAERDKAQRHGTKGKHPPPPMPQVQRNNPPPSAPLPTAWSDAILFAIGLGMRKAIAEERARELCHTYPHATSTEALRLMFDN